MKALGFRTEVAVEDCLSLLQFWGSSNQAFEARCEVDADCVAIPNWRFLQVLDHFRIGYCNIFNRYSVVNCKNEKFYLHLFLLIW